jgi:hypothetical protein
MQKPQPPKMIDRNNIGTTFSNIVNVSSTTNEVFLDFGLIAPATSIFGGAGDVTLVSRVILTKEHASQLVDTMAKAIQGSGETK